jgi:hypothetical protein
MGAVYLSLFGLGLRSWCSKVHEKLGLMLGGTLLFINSLVAVAPLARLMSGSDTQVLPIVGTGFYLGFAALAVAVVRFSRMLTVELSKDKRVVWFFGATLAVTFLQVFAWVHGYLKHLPHVYTYAPMVVLTGGLVLFVERRTLELRGQAEKHGAESFLGFAFIMTGVLMGIGHPYMRITAFSLAGVVWIASTLQRKHPLHAWIGLTLAVLGGASVGLLHGFPPPWLPSLGIALALGLGIFGLLARSSDLLARAAGGMKAAVLIVTVLVTVLAQLRYGSPPYIAAGHLAAVSALFGVLAWREQKIRWAQTGMTVLALALPYLAGFDFTQQVFHSTGLVTGLAVLSLLWIGATLAIKSPILKGARSTVLWIYGALALACMFARATIDDRASLDHPLIEIGGPTLMVAVLVWAGYFSRSWVPMLMAMLIGLILMRELRGNLAGIEAHHAQRGPFVEDHGQDRALPHQGQLDVVLLSLVEHQGEFLLAQEQRHLLRRRERPRHERGDGVQIVGHGLALARHQVAVLVHQERALRVRVLEEDPDALPDRLDVLLVEDESRRSQRVVGGSHRAHTGSFRPDRSTSSYPSFQCALKWASSF